VAQAQNRLLLMLLTDRAIADIDTIFDYVTRESSAERALAVEQEFFKRFTLLASRPGIGHRRNDLTSRRLLFSRVYNWLIIYSCGQEQITVRAVLHGARDVRAFLSRRIR